MWRKEKKELEESVEKIRLLREQCRKMITAIDEAINRLEKKDKQ